MSIEVRPFQAGQDRDWDDLVSRSFSGTFLHSRRFLSYHGERYRDSSACLYDGDRLLAVFPAAFDPEDDTCVTSHPGATYGGLVHDGRLRGNEMIEAVNALRDYYSELGLNRIRYKAVPRMYHRVPAEDDLYALFRVGARRYRCDLAAVVDLENRLSSSKRRQRCLRKALESDVMIQEATRCEEVADFWQVLEENLLRRHGVHPVHTLDEIRLLMGRFRDGIRLVVALANKRVIAGVLLFVTSRTMHAQYICANEIGHEVHALDAVIEHCIMAATLASTRWFSMGISNESHGLMLNDGLHRFKTEFGAGAMVHEFYELGLR